MVILPSAQKIFCPRFKPMELISGVRQIHMGGDSWCSVPRPYRALKFKTMESYPKLIKMTEKTNHKTLIHVPSSLGTSLSLGSVLGVVYRPTDWSLS